MGIGTLICYRVFSWYNSGLKWCISWNRSNWRADYICLDPGQFYTLNIFVVWNATSSSLCLFCHFSELLCFHFFFFHQNTLKFLWSSHIFLEVVNQLFFLSLTVGVYVLYVFKLRWFLVFMRWPWNRTRRMKNYILTSLWHMSELEITKSNNRWISFTQILKFTFA